MPDAVRSLGRPGAQSDGTHRPLGPSEGPVAGREAAPARRERQRGRARGWGCCRCRGASGGCCGSGGAGPGRLGGPEPPHSGERGLLGPVGTG